MSRLRNCCCSSFTLRSIVLDRENLLTIAIVNAVPTTATTNTARISAPFVLDLGCPSLTSDERCNASTVVVSGGTG